MKYSEILERLNNLFLEGNERLSKKELNFLLSQVENDEIEGIHGDLCDDALQYISSNIDEMSLPTGAKEHLLYKKYALLIDSMKSYDEKFLLDLVNDYQKYSFLALESLIIEMLKKDRISIQYFDLLDGLSETIRKEIFASLVRNKIREKVLLSAEETEQLYLYEKFTILEDAIENKLIDSSVLMKLTLLDVEGESKKRKESLRSKAEKALKHL
ncbi:hypothetical protein [Paenibacillus caui]|uniref:hypothetical protein n=1 Tax=Paenibacillus caui TaxID=2873927 RepID=UPI001CA82119|nr:hypothetical protein [Paenibacillus caui]